MIRQFRRKPAVIRAVEWTGENLDEIVALWGRGSGRVEGKMLVLRAGDQDAVFVALGSLVVEKHSPSHGRFVYATSLKNLLKKYDPVVPVTITPAAPAEVAS